MKDVKRWWMMGILGVLLIAMLGFGIYLSFFHNGEQKQTTEMVEKENVPSSDKKKVMFDAKSGKEDPLLNENKQELTSSEILMTENKVRQYYRDFRISDGLAVLNELAENNRFDSEDTQVLSDLQSDGSLWMNIFHDDNPEAEKNGLAIINGFQSFRDPETLLLAVLHLDSDIRQFVVLYGGSLNPISDSEDGVKLSILNKTTVEVPKNIQIKYPDVTKMHKIVFSYDGYAMDAYMLEHPDRTLQFYTIEDMTQKAPYYTMEQWTKINQNVKEGRPAMDGVLTMYASYGIEYVGESVDESSHTTEDKE